MYVCLCKGITDRQIRDAAERGCASVRDLRGELGVGSQCAKCVRHARDVLRDQHSALRADRRESAAVVYWPQPA